FPRAHGRDGHARRAEAYDRHGGAPRADHGRGFHLPSGGSAVTERPVPERLATPAPAAAGGRIRLQHRARRLYSLSHKETLQILRDPSTLLMAFVFPVVLLFIFGYGINLDSSVVRLGVVQGDRSPEA